MGRCGVAGDHNRLDTLCLEKVGDLLAETSNGVGTLGSIRHASGVAEIDHALGWELSNDLLGNGESANSRIEHANRRVAHRYHGIRAMILKRFRVPVRAT